MMPRVLPLIAAASEEGGGFDISSMILHHLADSHEWETPFGVIHLPQFAPVQVGPLSIDFSITKHVLFMMIAAVLVAILLIVTARDAKREHAAGAARGPKGAANVVEALILYIRDEVALKNIGHGGERYVPYIVSVFFFILFCNLLGLVPWGASPTGNLSVTATLAVITFITVELAGMRDLGPKGYLQTIFYAPHGMHWAMKIPMYMIMTPVEFLGKLTKPFALAIRLYANMTAGHAIVLALTGLIVVAGIGNVWLVGMAPLAMAIAIMVLEIFVAFLQAYIFAMLSSVFIGLIRHAH
ncbi:MAG TPA: F0F1 ATP synthase subunit A [Gemmatimonadaceae bacterium]|nr:F0F1 ATP synthase subunit A [Gemmatimonadaceae bacterium]